MKRMKKADERTAKAVAKRNSRRACLRKSRTAITPEILARYEEQLNARRAEIKILKKISETISYNSDLGQVLGNIIKIVINFMKSDSCFIYLVRGEDIILEASQNPHRAALGKIKMKMGEGITGWVAKHRQTVAIHQKAYEDDRFKFFNILPEDKFEAFLSVPIIAKGNVVGVVNVQHITERSYQRDKVAFMEIVARLVGGAIENARLLSQTNLLKEALETRKVLDRAKSILMETHNLTETEAHRLINKKSMDKRKSIKEIAEAIILSAEILK